MNKKKTILVFHSSFKARYEVMKSIKSSRKSKNELYDYISKEDEEGRNRDYHIDEMDNYQQMKDNIECIKRI